MLRSNSRISRERKTNIYVSSKSKENYTCSRRGGGSRGVTSETRSRVLWSLVNFRLVHTPVPVFRLTKHCPGYKFSNRVHCPLACLQQYFRLRLVGSICQTKYIEGFFFFLVLTKYSWDYNNNFLVQITYDLE